MEIAYAYINALTGDSETVMDFRCLHDVDRGADGINIRGSLSQVYGQLSELNRNGYGIFVSIQQMDGVGRTLANVQHIRTHIVDMDEPLTSDANYNQAVNSPMPPHMAVQTSPGKYHLYWFTEAYSGNDFYKHQQRALRQLYDGDKSVIDASRVLRVPGFRHMKNPQQPFDVTCWGISQNQRYTFEQIQQNLSGVNVFDSIAVRKELGDPDLAAPSLDWLYFAMSLKSPEDLSYDEWMSFTAAYKQAGWSLGDEQSLLNNWLTWCQQYGDNDLQVNMKLWESIKDTEVGWNSIKRRTTVEAYMKYGPPQQHMKTDSPLTMEAAIEHKTNVDTSGEILAGPECAEWFKNCFFIESEGTIFTESARYMNSTKFNGTFGGKLFMITSEGKLSDDPWKAALRSTIWSVPRVDHVRFLPNEDECSVVLDEFNRKGLNCYKKPTIKREHGDVSLFLNHVSLVLPDPKDAKILLDYMAYCAKFPGHKVPWAPMIQSVPGVGKGVFSEIMKSALGGMYIHKPKASALGSSGSKFNSWMQYKLMIMVDEIKDPDSCLLYTSPSPRDGLLSRMPSSA